MEKGTFIATQTNELTHFPYLCCQFKNMSKRKVCQIDILASKARDNCHYSRNCSQNISMCHHYTLYKVEKRRWTSYVA